MLMVGVEQHFVQASPIKHFTTFYALREVFFFFGRKLLVFGGCHCLTLTHRGLIGKVAAGSQPRWAYSRQSKVTDNPVDPITVSYRC